MCWGRQDCFSTTQTDLKPHWKTESPFCLSTWLKGQGSAQSGSVGSGRQRAPSVSPAEVTALVSSLLPCASAAARAPPSWTSWKAVGWLLWELMGAAGRGRREVLGTDPEIFREQVLFVFRLWLPYLLFLDLTGGSLSWSPWSLEGWVVLTRRLPGGGVQRVDVPQLC